MRSVNTYSVNIRELMDSIDDSVSPLFDQAIEDLIAQSLIHCEDGENFQITHDGINELEYKKRIDITVVDKACFNQFNIFLTNQ